MRPHEAKARDVMEMARDALRFPGLFEGAELRRAVAASAERLHALGAEEDVVRGLRAELRTLPAHAPATDVAKLALRHLQRLIR